MARVDCPELALDCFFSQYFLRLDSCIDSDLWMYGSIRRCDDFPLLALYDFRVIFGAIFGCFCSSLDLSI